MRTPKAVVSLAFLTALVLGSLAVPADAASPKKQCIKSRCNAQKKACLAGFRSQFTAVKAACGDGKCKRNAKRAKRQNGKRCKHAFKSCKKCCGTDPAAACNVEVAGDGVCGGSPRPGEQCDGQDAAACPGQCGADCLCSGGAGNPGQGGKVGEVSAVKALLVVVDAAPFSSRPFASGVGFLLTAMFQTVSGAPSLPVQQIGNCAITTATDDGSGGGTATPLDAGTPGQATAGGTVVDLVPSTLGPGTLEASLSPPTLLARGFDNGAQVDVSLPGGADIGAFSVSVRVPADLGLTVPNVLDPALRLDLTQALDFAWAAGDAAQTIDVVLTAGVASRTSPGPLTLAVCTLPDTGAGSIPADVMSHFPADANFIQLDVARTLAADVSVPLTQGGTGTVTAGGASLVSWTFTDVPPTTRR